MAAIKTTIFISLLALLFFYEYLYPLPPPVRGAHSNSVTGVLHRKILQTAAHKTAGDNVESSSERKMNNVHMKIDRRSGQTWEEVELATINRRRTGAWSRLLALDFFSSFWDCSCDI
ncbi:protein no-on-transient A-like [Cucumis melo var. makuwa]|uniref:Protein no-on-transient A-like n=1 Tax=Cucumis melo var. makuwa TaxID=1194695 RepID=A0A5A7VN87_CUCMM|nr:protein no-on-transient A-like [Cucumis melo var. makuwa]TYK18082.1 protein no-on-transient A-like [Cucumis melo var. makuwa]